MKMNINDVYVLQQILKRVALRDYDLIEDREVNALLELCNEECDAHLKRVYEMALAEEAAQE